LTQPGTIARRWRNFRQTGWRRRGLIAEAACWLLVSRLALIFVPFPKLAKRIGDFVPPADPRVAAAGAPVGPDAAALARDVSWAVTRGAIYVPFRAVCLPQAMAARIMLKRRGVASAMHFGAARGKDKPLDAHAWLDAAGVKVTGYPVANQFAEIACFV
jgi:hypothetical protein